MDNQKNLSDEMYLKKEDRSKLLGYQNKVIWFTGLSGSGKTTLAKALEKKLHEKGILSYVLDGDNIRKGLNRDLGFTSEEREENIRRIREITKLFHDTGIFVITSFISPFKEDRERAKEVIGNDFIEVYLNCSLEECQNRDKKGLYKKAEEGGIDNFTGISQKYEKPENPSIVIDTGKTSVEESVNLILDYLKLGHNPKT
ncbi:MAG: adenylyl-sulfate kinase [Candidatus Nanoarchaeia archaeon]|nr:adenylyl-sulfate kinase [Candidatus Nanoarchaeia archaeon]